ncbi:IMPACT family protein [Reinekea blandensis]|uniref:Impact N-terminal domain-containing protein n=1 Tax=Reinekea blandensis MED297 TaxID=314283 RepID=A4BEA6_9GAMM|nr:YigZ family protein [Reinekea blandensis]EAR09584.1 hypothetical protein MED297_12672 [Reinekea blandensis MED297]
MSKTLSAPVYTELEIKKSRFLCWFEPIESVEQVKQRLEAIRQQHLDARHVCYAFYVNNNSGMGDDGEPSGTAGRPMFNVIAHKDLHNVLAVVVRYFGGIKLGAGGLSRAYGGAVSQAAEQAEFVVLEASHQLKLSFPFALESQIRRVLSRYELTLDAPAYSDRVSATVTVTDSQVEALQQDLQALAPADPDLVVERED